MSALVAPSSANAGTRITVSNTARNHGGAGARSSITKFYLSTNSTFGAGDILLGSHGVPSLAAGASSTASTALTVPAGTAPGSYYLLAVSDATKLVTEARENNNARSRALIIP
jgi:subtilase family serine protease